jgi:arylsulfatase A-like enzyme/Tfp pilus assembly protein PilF
MRAVAKRSRRAPSGSASPLRALRSRKKTLGIGLAVFVAVVLAVAMVAARARHARTHEAAHPRLSVLLVSIDTLRADAVGAYGNRAAQTPWMDRLAAGGVRFETARAHNVVTLPSHANLLSGRYPLAHGIRDNSGFRFPAGTPTLATILREHGYRTAAFVGAFPLDSRFGLDAGFEVYDDRLGGGETRPGLRIAERPGTRVVEAAARWLKEQGDAPVFCFVHLYEPHFPYVPPPPFAERFAGRPYHGEVAAADAALEPLLRPVFEAGKAGRTLVVLTSDHGEALGDHGEETHGLLAYEATLRVPLVLFAPSVFGAAVAQTPARHVDVLPTVLDFLGVEAPGGLDGVSLRRIVGQGPAAAPPTYFEALSASLNRGWAPLQGLVDQRWKYIDLPIPELYDLGEDPGEKRNLAAARPADADRLRRALEGLRAGDRKAPRETESAETVKRLRALGYVAGGGAKPKDRYTEADDPKRLIALDGLSSEMLSRYWAGDLEGALAAGQEILRQRPDDPLVHLQFAYLERARGNLDAALAAARRTVALRPADAESAALLGVYLTEAGRPAETIALLEPFLAQPRPDLDVLTAHGMALAQLQRRKEALEVFARAAAVDPSNAIVKVNAGTVHLMEGQLAQARAAFEQALALDPDVARAHNSLGVVAARENRMADAVEHWKRAVALDPRDYQTLFNLGSVLHRQGRRQEARPYLEAYVRVAPARQEAQDVARVRAWLAQEAGGAPSQ